MFAPGVTFITLLPFILLLVAVLGLWIHRAVWISVLTAAVAAGYHTDALQGAAALWIAVLAALAFLFARVKARPMGGIAQVAAGLAFFLFALVMGLALLPGFPRTVVVGSVVLSPGALPYSLGLGFPKPTLASTRNRKYRKSITDLVMTNTGSTVFLRSA
jgi:hypothetical protein